MDSFKIISTAKITALITFIGGTLLLLFFYLTNDLEVGMLGLAYAAIMTIVNIVILTRLVFQLYKNKITRQFILKATGFMLLNIPVVILYCWLGLILMNTVRITFINSTGAEIKNLKIEGCEERFIQKLQSEQSKTIWVNIPDDCGIDITYELNGQTKHEDVTGYVTNDGGYITTFKIGASQKSYDHDL